MIPAISAPVTATSAGTPAGSAQPANTTSPKPVQVAPSGRGETAAAATQAATARAVEAPPQAVLALRLRDGETAETEPAPDKPAGPPPTFDETILQRDARLAREPAALASKADTEKTQQLEPDTSDDASDGPGKPEGPARANDVSAASRKAEETFSETKKIAQPPEPASVDVSR